MYVWPLCGRVYLPQRSAKIRSNTYSLVYLALLLDSAFGQVLSGITSNWPFFARQSTEFIGISTLVCVPITAPGCSGPNMLVSSRKAVAPPKGQTSRHQAKEHQNPRTHHFASLSPFVTQGFWKFTAQAGSCPKENFRKTEDVNHRSRLSKCRTLSTTIFGHCLFRNVSRLTFHSRTRTYQFKNCHIIVCQEFCQCTIDILNTQAFVENEIKDFCEHAHTHYSGSHCRTHIQRIAILLIVTHLSLSSPRRIHFYHCLWRSHPRSLFAAFHGSVLLLLSNNFSLSLGPKLAQRSASWLCSRKMCFTWSSIFEMELGNFLFHHEYRVFEFH